MKPHFSLFAFAFALAAVSMTATAFAKTYQESDGLVVMEIESTPSALGLWQKEISLAGYTGSGYLRFMGNTYETGPARSPLEFSFKINQGGLYYLHLHCAKEVHDGRSDVANDCYVRVEGDYNAGPNAGNSHGNDAPLSMLKSDTKYYGGAVNSWKWESGDANGGNLDPGGHENKRVAVYDFKAGETYKLVVSGRSKFFRINRLMFRHTSVGKSSAQNLNNPESASVSGDTIYLATADFPNLSGGEVPYYKDTARGALAIDASVVDSRDKFARAQRTFDGASGYYDVSLTALRELDGECSYRFLVNGVVAGSAKNGTTATDYAPQEHIFANIMIPAGATIAVESNSHTNGAVPEGDGTAWARGRWTQLAFTTSTALVRPPAGRIAVVMDGNSPDPDDIGALAVILGLLKGAGVKDRLVHLSHSCDLDPFSGTSNQTIDATNELRRQNKLHAVCEEGIGFFGPFPNLTNYYNCRADQEGAVNDLRDAINASSDTDPLWIVEAGEPDIIGYALQAATSSKRQFVRVISHHSANDNSGDYFTWQQILDFGVAEHQIGDQNVGLQVLISTGLWDWAFQHPEPEIAWIWDQLKYAEQDTVVGFQNNKFDCSDAGMVYWWITGASNGGNHNSTPVEIRAMLFPENADEEGTPGEMSGLVEDTDIRDDLVIIDPTLTTLVPGRSGTSPGFNRASIFVFQLPDLGQVANPFTRATFTFNVTSVSTSPPDVDLYGLGKRAAPTVLGSDYYGESATPDPTDSVLIQSNLLTASTGTGIKSSSAASALASYLNTQYDGGNGIGSYVFLRLSTNSAVPLLRRHFITSADGAVSNPSLGPKVSYTALTPGNFDSWIEPFNLPANLRGLDDDPDGDGLNNGIEAWFGSHPGEFTAGINQVETSGLVTTFTHPQNAAPPVDLIGSYEWSEDLADWYSGDGADGPGTGRTVSISAVTGDSAASVTATSSTPAPSIFLRAKVERAASGL